MAVVPEVDVDLVYEHGVGVGLGGMKGEGLVGMRVMAGLLVV